MDHKTVKVIRGQLAGAFPAERGKWTLMANSGRIGGSPMPRRGSLSSLLFRAARTARNVEAVERSLETSDPSHAARRAENLALGQLLAWLGVWRRLWR